MNMKTAALLDCDNISIHPQRAMLARPHGTSGLHPYPESCHDKKLSSFPMGLTFYLSACCSQHIMTPLRQEVDRLADAPVHLVPRERLAVLQVR